MSLDQERQLALLRTTLREVLRIAKAAEADATSVAFEDALDGRLRKDWKNIRSKANLLVGPV